MLRPSSAGSSRSNSVQRMDTIIEQPDATSPAASKDRAATPPRETTSPRETTPPRETAPPKEAPAPTPTRYEAQAPTQLVTLEQAPAPGAPGQRALSPSMAQPLASPPAPEAPRAQSPTAPRPPRAQSPPVLQAQPASIEEYYHSVMFGGLRAHPALYRRVIFGAGSNQDVSVTPVPSPSHSPVPAAAEALPLPEGTLCAWRVCFQGRLRVRSSTRGDCETLGFKKYDDIVYGQQDGNWLVLDEERGIMMVMNQETRLLERAQSKDKAPPSGATLSAPASPRSRKRPMSPRAHVAPAQVSASAPLEAQMAAATAASLFDALDDPLQEASVSVCTEESGDFEVLLAPTSPSAPQGRPRPQSGLSRRPQSAATAAFYRSVVFGGRQVDPALYRRILFGAGPEAARPPSAAAHPPAPSSAPAPVATSPPAALLSHEADPVVYLETLLQDSPPPGSETRLTTMRPGQHVAELLECPTRRTETSERPEELRQLPSALPRELAAPLELEDDVKEEAPSPLLVDLRVDTDPRISHLPSPLQLVAPVLTLTEAPAVPTFGQEDEEPSLVSEPDLVSQSSHGTRVSQLPPPLSVPEPPAAVAEAPLQDAPGAFEQDRQSHSPRSSPLEARTCPPFLLASITCMDARMDACIIARVRCIRCLLCTWCGARGARGARTRRSVRTEARAKSLAAALVPPLRVAPPEEAGGSRPAALPKPRRVG